MNNNNSYYRGVQPRMDTVNINENTKLISKRRIQDLIAKIDPMERIDPEAEEILLEIADEFIENVARSACRIAKHRKTQTLEVKDVQLHLERNWNIRIPGFASEEIRTTRKANVPSSYTAKATLVNNLKNNKVSKKEANIAAIQALNSTTAPVANGKENKDKAPSATPGLEDAEKEE